MFWSVTDHVHNVLSSSDMLTVQTSEDITYGLVLIYCKQTSVSSRKSIAYAIIDSMLYLAMTRHDESTGLYVCCIALSLFQSAFQVCMKNIC